MDDSPQGHFVDWVASIAVSVGLTFPEAVSHSPSQLMLMQSAVCRRDGELANQSLNLQLTAIGAFKSRNGSQSVRDVRREIEKMTHNYGRQDS